MSGRLVPPLTIETAPPEPMRRSRTEIFDWEETRPENPTLKRRDGPNLKPADQTRYIYRNRNPLELGGGDGRRFYDEQLASGLYAGTGYPYSYTCDEGSIPSTGLLAQYEPWRWSNSDGDALSSIVDSSGNGHNLGVTSSARPIFRTGIVGGKAVARFTGATTGFVCGAASGVSAAFAAAGATHTLASVWVPRSVSSFGQVAGWVGDNGSVATNVNTLSQDGSGFYQREGGVTGITGGSPTVGVAVEAVSVAAPSTTGELWIDGVQVGTHAWGAYGGGAEFSIASTWHHSEQLFTTLELDLAALFVYSVALAGSNLANLKTYLHRTYISACPGF